MKARSILSTVAITFLVLFTLISTSQATSLPPLLNLLATPQPLAGPNSIFIPLVNNGAPLVTTDEWTQFAHGAARTGFTAKSIPTPWRWKWSWNGPTATGTVSAGKIRLPRNVQPVTGGGRVYIAAGANGVYALNVNNGSQAWHATGLGDINSTPAYDPSTASLFVVSAN